MKFSHLLVVAVFLVTCSPKKDEPVVKNGIVTIYRDDRRVHKELSYKNDKLDGLSKEYHKNGNLYLETEWKDDIRHGITKQYYPSGKLYSETRYDSGRITGILKRYHKDGKLKAEVPYRLGEECLGLKEYILNGDPRPYYPSIVAKFDDKTKVDGIYYVKLSISERVYRVTFYRGELEDDCLHSKLERIYQPTNYEATFGYQLAPGGFMSRTDNFIAKIETITGNTLVVQKSVGISASRGY